jgi:hypothetical protein
MNGRTIVLAAALALAGIAPPVSAADFGVGADFLDRRTILFPIRTESFLIEPEIRFNTSSSAASGGQTSSDYAPGLGVYLRKESGPQFETYWGARVGYQMSKDTVPGLELKDSTWRVTPAIGVQHFFSKQFSVGLDIGLQYSTTESKTSTPTSSATGHEHGWDSIVRVLLRAYLW